LVTFINKSKYYFKKDKRFNVYKVYDHSTNPLNGNLQLPLHMNVMSTSKIDDSTQWKCLRKTKRVMFNCE